MKRFYTTLALAAAVVLSASAADFSARKVARPSFSPAPVQEMQLVETNVATPVKKAPLAKAKPTKVEDIYGYYTINAKLIWGSVYNNPLNFIINPSGNANEVSIEGMTLAGTLPLTGVFDPAAGTLTIASPQPLSNFEVETQGGSGIIEFIHGTAVQGDGGGYIFQELDTPLVITFDDECNPVFGALDGYFELIKNSGGYGYGGIAAITGTKMQPLSDEGWEDYGKATFTDGWFSPGIQYLTFSDNNGPMITNAIPNFDVALQRNKENTNIFRLVDPWGGNYNELVSNAIGAGEVLPFNGSYLNGCVEFDITNPKCVLVSPDCYSGLYDDYAAGFGLMYMTNQAGKFVYESMVYENETKEDALDVWIEVMSTDPTYKFSTYDADARLVTISDAMFKSNNADGLLINTWTDYLDFLKEYYPEEFSSYPLNSIDMTSYIVMPDPAGLNNIIMDKTNSTLEYYNLQGVRVNNPSNGIYIRRQGNDVQKVYVR